MKTILKIMKNKIGIGFIFLVFGFLFYWNSVLTICNSYYDECIRLKLDGLLAHSEGRTRVGDSLFFVGGYNKVKAENTLKLLPKILRP